MSVIFMSEPATVAPAKAHAPFKAHPWISSRRRVVQATPPREIAQMILRLRTRSLL